MADRRRKDPRWRWLMAAVRELYEDLEPDEMPGQIAVLSADRDGALVTAVIVAGKPGIERRVVTDVGTCVEMVERSTVVISKADE